MPVRCSKPGAATTTPSGRIRAWAGSRRWPMRLVCSHRVRNGTGRPRSLGAPRPVPLRLPPKAVSLTQGLWPRLDETRGAGHRGNTRWRRGTAGEGGTKLDLPRFLRSIARRQQRLRSCGIGYLLVVDVGGVVDPVAAVGAGSTALFQLSNSIFPPCRMVAQVPLRAMVWPFWVALTAQCPYPQESGP